MELKRVEALHDARGLGQHAVAPQAVGGVEDPRVAIAAAGHKDSLGTRLAQHRDAALGAHDVARTDDGHLHRLGHALHHAPVGRARVELLGSTAMHGDAAGAHIFQATCKLGGNLVGHVDAGTNLAGDGHSAGRPAQRLHHDVTGALRVFHESAALAFLEDLGHRACHVDVDEGKAVAQTLKHGVGRGGKLLRLATEKLYGNLRLGITGINEFPGLLATVGQACNRHHLGVAKRAPMLDGHLAVDRVGHARHGGKHERVRGQAGTQGLALVAHVGFFCGGK